MNGNATLDTRVTFILGGPCENQLVRYLMLFKVEDSGNEEMVYICSNLATRNVTLCNSTDKFSVVSRAEPSCGLKCKYDIELVLMNFNASDVGKYRAKVSFRTSSAGLRRPIQREFDLQLANGNVNVYRDT